MTKTEKLKVGIVGSGVFGGYHASKYINNPDVELSAIYDLHYDRAKTLAVNMDNISDNKNFLTVPFSNYDSFLRQVDMIVIATTASTHFVLALKALEAGIHCLVEKPLAIDTQEADMLVEIAKKNKVTLQVGHQERYVLEAMGLLPFKYNVKEINSVRIGTYSGRGSDVSVVYDLMIHDIDLARRLTNSSLMTVKSNFLFREENTQKCHADEVEAIIKLQDETKLSFLASRMADHQERNVKIILEEGEIFIDFLSRKIVNNTDIELKSFNEIADLPAIKDPLGKGASSFIKAVKNQQEPTVTGKQGRDAVYWAQKINQQNQCASNYLLSEKNDYEQ